MCVRMRIFNEVNNQENNNKMNNENQIKMTKKQEVLTYLSKQILEKKGMIEFTKKQPSFDAWDESALDRYKEEMSILLNAMDLILGE
jgi:hypothetical protein